MFKIKRGLATGADRFFILTAETASKLQIPTEFLKPILPQPRYLSSDEIQAVSIGNTCSDCRLFLLDCIAPEDVVKERYPALWNYLQTGVEQKINQHYLCKNRSPWYSQEERPSPPLLCTCMGRRSRGRDKPLRFILNLSNATATNAYLMLYPKRHLRKIVEKNPTVLRAIWQALNDISLTTLIFEGRTYGGGLCKIEPRELGNTPADGVAAVLPSFSNRHQISNPQYCSAHA